MRLAVKAALASVLAALGVVIAPFLWFAWGPTKAFPGQHLVNVLAGVLLGPAWAALVATVVGTIRIALGVGTVYAYPGGIPGGIVVGVAYHVLRRVTKRRKVSLVAAALTEPLGTVLVGGAISWYLFDPFFGGAMHARFATILWLFLGWAASSVTGAVLGAACLLALDASGVLRAIERT